MVDQSADEVASGSPAERARPRVVLGVAGGIAAYKACEVLRRFSESGHDVTVVPTAAALEFVGAPTWAALSGKPVSDRVWDDVHEVPHVRIGQQADLVVVAPATADLLAKAAHGLADDLLTNTLLTARCPVLMVPAMHTEMWEHPATRDNVATLRARGVHVLEPAEGRLTGADTGKGRLPDPEAIVEAGRDLLVRPAAIADLTGRRVVVSAGGTREFLDPVRFLGNRSSGRQGFALARAAAARGAEVTLVAANTDLTPPAGVDVRRVVTTAELREAMLEAAADADAIVMAAAPADFAPAAVSSSKIKKSADGTVEPIKLVQNPDILAELVAEREGRKTDIHRVIVGFAAETGDANASVMEHAQAKLARKGCDLLVLNDVGGGAVFGETDNEAWILEHPGGSGRSRPGAAPSGPERIERGPKALLSHAIWDRVARLLDAAGAQQTSPPEPPDRHGASVES